MFWKVAVRDVATMSETALEAGHRSVDDQVDWRDDQHVVYHPPNSDSADI